MTGLVELGREPKRQSAERKVRDRQSKAKVRQNETKRQIAQRKASDRQSKSIEKEHVKQI